MNHGILKQVIFDQHEVVRNAVINPRSHVFEKNANYVLVGIRRAGKSTLFYKIVQDLISDGIDWKRIVFINFEDERLDGFSVQDFNDILQVQSELSSEKGLFFFDEIQIVPGWEKFVRRMADAKERVYVTGSNAKMLSGEIGTTLGGRFLTKTIWPYDFGEYLSAQKISWKNASTKELGIVRRYFDTYLKFGGFPESLSYSDMRGYVSSIYQKILLGDMVSRHQVRNPNALRLMVKKLAESTKDQMSYAKIKSILSAIGLNISKETIIDYVGYAEESYLLFHVRNYFATFTEKEGTPKYYFCDNGLLNLFLCDKEPLLLENLVAITLYKQYGEGVYFLKSARSGIDVDFFVPEEGTAIQVAYSLENVKNDRETRNLVVLAKQKPEVSHLMILTNSEEKTLTVDGKTITVMPVWKWLLTDKGEGGNT